MMEQGTRRVLDRESRLTRAPRQVDVFTEQKNILVKSTNDPIYRGGYQQTASTGPWRVEGEGIERLRQFFRELRGLHERACFAAVRDGYHLDEGVRMKYPVRVECEIIIGC